MKIKPSLPMVIGFVVAFCFFRAIDVGGIWTYLAVVGITGTICFIAGAIWQVQNDQVARFNRREKDNEVVGP